MCHRSYKFRLDSAGLGDEQGKEERAQNIRRQHQRPQPQRVTDMAAFGQHQRDGVQRVLRKQLRAAQDDDDKSDGIKRVDDELRATAVTEQSCSNRGRQSSQPHPHAPSEAGDEKAERVAIQLLPCVLRDLLVDRMRSRPFQFELRRGGVGLGALFRAPLESVLGKSHGGLDAV